MPKGREDIERRIAAIMDEYGVTDAFDIGGAAGGGHLCCNTVAKAITPPDPAIQVAAPDLVAGAGGLYQEVLSFVLAYHAADRLYGVPDYSTLYKRAVHRLREVGWCGNAEYDHD